MKLRIFQTREVEMLPARLALYRRACHSVRQVGRLQDVCGDEVGAEAGLSMAVGGEHGAQGVDGLRDAVGVCAPRPPGDAARVGERRVLHRRAIPRLQIAVHDVAARARVLVVPPRRQPPFGEAVEVGAALLFSFDAGSAGSAGVSPTGTRWLSS